MPIDYRAIGATLKAARRKRKLTQAHVARKLGMTATNVSYIENGKIKTSLANLEAYANLVGCRLAVVLVQPEDARGQLAARIVDLLPSLEEPLVETLEAWADLWETRRAAAARPRPG